ncbi:MAG: bacteroferritin-associated ferredoxin [Idiomarinaceae bacterium HL-53]|nr:MAG: bacteroferritin-associated ferredoxin [Idiomarinaceae bacterium HL-53]CUS48437.1 bacterioferritin-associated ferredoxin [Idiomarinaceae bacterium HL-53]
MYVCLCKGVTDGDIKNAVASGCRSLRELKRETGLATQCGKCSCHARDILHEELHTQCTPVEIHPNSHLGVEVCYT